MFFLADRRGLPTCRSNFLCQKINWLEAINISKKRSFNILEVEIIMVVQMHIIKRIFICHLQDQRAIFLLVSKITFKKQIEHRTSDINMYLNLQRLICTVKILNKQASQKMKGVSLTFSFWRNLSKIGKYINMKTMKNEILRIAQQ